MVANAYDLEPEINVGNPRMIDRMAVLSLDQLREEHGFDPANPESVAFTKAESLVAGHLARSLAVLSHDIRSDASALTLWFDGELTAAAKRYGVVLEDRIKTDFVDYATIQASFTWEDFILFEAWTADQRLQRWERSQGGIPRCLNCNRLFLPNRLTQNSWSSKHRCQTCDPDRRKTKTAARGRAHRAKKKEAQK